MKKILATGGTGYIGSHTVIELINGGYEVDIIDNLFNSKITVLDQIEKITGKKPKFFQVDLLDEEKLDEVFRDGHYDTVIHFAGLKAVGESVEKPLIYYRNNITGTVNLLEAMKKYGVHEIVFSSSATVYGEQDTPECVETMQTGMSLTNPYGRTKYFIEEIMKDYAVADPEFKATLLRYFNPIGAHASGLIGEDPNGIPNNLMPAIMRVADGRIDKLRVYGDDYPTADGTGRRDYIHVVDLAKGHLKALEYAETHTGTEAINLGTGTGYSVLDVIHAYEDANGVKIPYEIVARRPGDVAENYADPKKALELLGWKAERDLVNMCRTGYHWQSMNPNGYDA